MQPSENRTAAPPPPTTRASASTSTMPVANLGGKVVGGERIKQKEKKVDAVQGGAIESDVESKSGLIIDEPAKEAAKDRAATGQGMQSARADITAATLRLGGEAPMEVQGEEQEMETEVALDLNVPTPESEAAMTVSSPTPTPISIYSTVVSASQVPSIPTPTLSTITNCSAICPILAFTFYAMSQSPHSS